MTYAHIVCNKNINIDNLRLPREIEKDYFNKLSTKDPASLNKFLQDFNLKIPSTNPNFAVIPININGHITTLIVDLSNNNKSLEDRLYSFDSSLYHYNPDVFGGLLKNDHKLSNECLQVGECCAIWTYNCCDECFLKFNDINDLINEFKTFKIQTRIANRVSGIIDNTLCNGDCVEFKEGFEINKMCSSYCVNLSSIDEIRNCMKTSYNKYNIHKLYTQEDKRKCIDNIEKQNHRIFDIMHNRINKAKTITSNIEKQIKICEANINGGVDVDKNKMTLVNLLAQIDYYKDKMYNDLFYEKDSFSKIQYDTSNTNRVNADEILFNNLQNYCNDNIISSNSEYFKFKTQTFTHGIPPVTQTYEDYFNKMKEYYKTTNVHKIGMGAPNLLMTSIGSLSKVSVQQVNSTETPRQQPITPVVSTKQASFSVVDTK